MNRHDRRAQRARERAILRAARPTDAERESLRVRQQAALARASGLTIPQDTSGMVLLLTEEIPPTLATWTLLPSVLLGLGLELHEDIARVVEARLSRGELPILTYIDGWMQCHAGTVMRMSPGGAA